MAGVVLQIIAARADLASLAGVIHSDGELSGAELCLATARALRGAGPWGQGFPEPLFDGDFHIIEARTVGERHLKMQLGAEQGSIEAIAFGYFGGPTQDDRLCRGARVRVAYRLEVNDYRGAERVQMNCQHLQVA